MDILEQQAKEFRRKIAKVLDAIKLELSSLRSDVKNQTQAISESTKADEKQRQVVPKVVAEAHFPSTIETQKSKKDADSDTHHQRWMLLLSFLTLLAVAWYAYEAHKQSQSVKDSADAAKSAAETASDQTKLTRQQLIATSAAVVDVQPSFDGALAVGENKLRMTFTDSRSPASNLCSEYQVILSGNHATRIDKPPDINFAQDFPPTDPTVQGDWNGEYGVSLSPKEFNGVNDTSVTIFVKGTNHYWNGFESTNKEFCYAWYGFNFKGTGQLCGSVGDNKFVRCDSFPHLLASARLRQKTCIAQSKR